MKKIAFAGCFVLVTALAASVVQLWAQSPAAGATFEVASVKPSAPGDPANPISMVPMLVPSPTGSIRGQNLPLRLLVRAAYKVEDEQIAGGPPWQLSAKYDITAKAPDDAAFNEDVMRARLQALLADRFKLKVHTEQREQTVSALVLARADGKLGPNLKPSTADCSNAAAEAQKLAEEIRKNPANAQAALAQVKCGIVPVPSPGGPGGAPQLMIRGMGQPIANLLSLITQLTGRRVIDKTGLTGPYDFEMEMPLDPEMLRRVASQVGLNMPPPGAGGANIPQYDGPAIGTILQDRLGLKLDTQKAQVDMLVIDSAEMPTAD